MMRAAGIVELLNRRSGFRTRSGGTRSMARSNARRASSRSAGAIVAPRASQSCSTAARHHRALRCEARIGRPPTSTSTGLVCICGKWRRATQLLRSIGTLNSRLVDPVVGRHLAASRRHGR